MMTPALRHSLTVIALGGIGNLGPDFTQHHINLTPECAMSPFCECKPWLIYESRADGSEIWQHHDVRFRIEES
jgi:hypothetical protein